MPGEKTSLGVCLGASTVSIVQVGLSGSGPNAAPHIIDHALYPHDGNPSRTLIRALEPLDLSQFKGIAATGRKFCRFLNLTTISEPEAVETAYPYVKPAGLRCPAIVSAGGETFMVYVLNRQGRIINVLTGNKCASGTGEFFLQQLRRMDVSLEEAARWASVETPYEVSGRCSVFCKSDCTHATNKGIPKSRVAAGLCRMMASKIVELLKKVERRDIMITGGTARNQMMIEYLRREIQGLIVPEQAAYMEALGAALWALHHETVPFPGLAAMFTSRTAAFDRLPPLDQATAQVEFKTMATGQLQPGDDCILGLDVGSTTTKAILMRTADNTILASIYLRTDGDPVGASRRCYKAIMQQARSQIGAAHFSVHGIGVCGSGRQIAGLHASTDGVINEIIAHAAAAVYFDPEVDTLFEIGGQDAKYTYITNAVPSDYAMNEACSAGTGSFLEESALESLGLPMEDIAGVALQGHSPPNFNDQCAAFISSDIKNAIHERVSHADIVAGLVYSICMNYTNRVKGNRPVGQKVFMQGGVCYNRAIPLAMATLVGKPIVVPPEPGLMGAFGAALEIKARIAKGQLATGDFDLAALAEREITYGRTFTCKGGPEKCDRRCKIARLGINGKQFAFGGACNRYDNLRRNIRIDIGKLDLVGLRHQLLFEDFAPRPGAIPAEKWRGRIGFNRSFLVNAYYPLYANFFSDLGFEPVLPGRLSQAGVDQKNAPFCYPAELAHGFFHTLLESDQPPEFIFLPHFKSIPKQNGSLGSLVCPFVQGETFYLRAAFRDQITKLASRGTRLLTPLIDLERGLEDAGPPLVASAMLMGVTRPAAEKAFAHALEKQRACLRAMQRIGQEAIAHLETDPEKMAVVLCGRPYNAFVGEANMSIPHKIATRDIMVIPLDFIPIEDQRAKRHMYWGMGQMMLKVGRLVASHPQLFSIFITNFSCGPDSFIIGYYRDIMGKKPSLTLELDNHTADAGLETRIEAFFDVVAAYRQLTSRGRIAPSGNGFVPARILNNGRVPKVMTSSGEQLPMSHPRVTLLVPSMGGISSEALAAVFRSGGYNAKAHEPADENVLKLGRGNTSCKECLPLILTTGTLLNYVHNGRRDDEVVVFFMPSGTGPCRFGQYFIFMEDLVRRLELTDVALFSLNEDSAYTDLGNDFHKKGWWAVVVSDVLEDIRSMLLTNASDIEAALDIFEVEIANTLKALEKGSFPQIESQLRNTADRLSRIRLKRPVAEVPTILLTGEIFVRRDALSRQNITEKLAAKGFATICSPIAEWLHYVDYLDDHINNPSGISLMARIGQKLRRKAMHKYETRIKSVLASSGLVHPTPVQVETVISKAAPFISPQLTGEAILTVGSSLSEVVSDVCGVIAIGPFGCMPNRLSESILSDVMTPACKLASEPNNEKLRTTLAAIEDLPFLSIESDGSPFPQLVTAKLEAFCLRAQRLHDRIIDVA